MKPEKVFIYAPGFYGIDKAIAEAFELAGVQCVLGNSQQMSIGEKTARELGNRISLIKPLTNKLLKRHLDLENKEFLRIVEKEKPDLLFIIKGDSLLPETLKKLKNKITLAAYIWDDPFFSYSKQYNLGDDYRKSNFELGMFLYDYVFVYDTYYVDTLKKRGLLNVKYLPLAADPKRYREIVTTPEDTVKYGYDLCFVGCPYPNRVEILDSLKQYNLGVFGEGWEKYFLQKGKKLPSYYKGKASGDKVLSIYLSSKIVLNIHDPEAREGLNTRTFDILACGASELVDYRKNLDVHFKMGKEMIAFKDKTELLSAVSYYLKNMGLLSKVAIEGRQRVLTEHTWDHRVRTVLDVLNEH